MPTAMHWHSAATVCLFAVVLSGCSLSSDLEQYSDYEMQEKMNECRRANEPTPAFLFACENYERECERRSDKAGFAVCS